ncbi:hypothetical protein V8C34DRAFT_295069 [Trichoderma compactum]
MARWTASLLFGATLFLRSWSRESPVAVIESKQSLGLDDPHKYTSSGRSKSCPHWRWCGCSWAFPYILLLTNLRLVTNGRPVIAIDVISD